ncbi:hypothetical protein HYX10_06555 [Candidatus Woesearchaeota archaeon]|nr:hypothetical protein [Candidatus Woesearchaeota archaeon]
MKFQTLLAALVILVAFSVNTSAQSDCTVEDADVFFSECKNVDCSIEDADVFYGDLCPIDCSKPGADAFYNACINVDCSNPDADVFYGDLCPIDCSKPGADAFYNACINVDCSIEDADVFYGDLCPAKPTAPPEVTPPGLPNLAFVTRSVQVSGDMNSNNLINFDVSVTNTGSVPVGKSFRVEWQLDGVPVAAPEIDGLRVGEEKFVYSNAVEKKLGTHKIEVMLDSGNFVAESNENDNSLTFRFEVVNKFGQLRVVNYPFVNKLPVVGSVSGFIADAEPNQKIAISVDASDEDTGISSIKLYLLSAGSETLLHSVGCGDKDKCSAVLNGVAPAAPNTEFEFRIDVLDTHSGIAKASTGMGRTREERKTQYRCSGSQIQKCEVRGDAACTDFRTVDTCSSDQLCTENDDSAAVPQCVDRQVAAPPVTPPPTACVWAPKQSEVCAGVSFTQSCGNVRITAVGTAPAGSSFCPAAPIPPGANIAPQITSFTIPATADAGSTVTATVTATDADGVSTIGTVQILQDSTVIGSGSCGDIPAGLACIKSFFLSVPGTFSTVYTFIAKVIDSDGAVAAATASGITNPAPAEQEPEPEPEPAEVLDKIDVKVKPDALFVSTVVPETSCISPGGETYLYASVQNRGNSRLKDVKIAATVQELGIRAVSGPFSLSAGKSAARFLYFSVPPDAEEGLYYIRVHTSSQKDSDVKHRMFEVNSRC